MHFDEKHENLHIGENGDEVVDVDDEEDDEEDEEDDDEDDDGEVGLEYLQKPTLEVCLLMLDIQCGLVYVLLV